MDKPYTLKYTRRNLPHWLVADHSYFVTLRLKGTLPKQVIEEFHSQRKALKDSNSDATSMLELSRKQFASIERILDSVSDIHWLENQDVASIVWNSLDWLREQGWLIYAGVMMSNHIHLLMRNEEGRTQEMLTDLARFKNYTAREANKLLDRNGSFWAREDFDHWVRNREKFEGTVRYIANNPVKAGLVNTWDQWEWFVVEDSVRYCLGDGKASA